MKKFKSMEDINRHWLPSKHRNTVRKEMYAITRGYGRGYDPNLHGYVIYVERHDSVIDFRDVGFNPEDGGLAGAMFEVVWYDPVGGCFVGFTLANNEFGLSIVIPDLPWLDPKLRKNLVDNLEEDDKEMLRWATTGNTTHKPG